MNKNELEKLENTHKLQSYRPPGLSCLKNKNSKKSWPCSFKRHYWFTSRATSRFDILIPGCSFVSCCWVNRHCFPTSPNVGSCEPKSDSGAPKRSSERRGRLILTTQTKMWIQKNWKNIKFVLFSSWKESSYTVIFLSCVITKKYYIVKILF